MTHNLPIKSGRQRRRRQRPKEPTEQTYRFHFSIYAFLGLLISVHLYPISIIYTTTTGRSVGWLVVCLTAAAPAGCCCCYYIVVAGNHLINR